MSEDVHAETPAPTQPDRLAAQRLGYAGLLPFAALAVWLAAIPLDHPWREMNIRLLVGYAAVVLSFLGGLRWGVATAERDPRATHAFAIGVLPAIGGWVALFLPPHIAFVLLAVAFAAHGAWDALSGPSGAIPDWYARMRIHLTVGVVAAMLLAFAATA